MRELCPQVMSSRKKLRSLLCGSLQNRRAYLKRKNSLVMSPRGRKRRPIQLQRNIQPRKLLSLSTDSSSFTPGEDVELLFKDECIGKGMFITQENEMFARVMVKNVASAAKRKTETEISLPVPTSDGKKYFHQLRVKDIITWRSSKLKSTKNASLTKPTDTSTTSSNDPLDAQELVEESHVNGTDNESDSSSEDSSSDTSDDIDSGVLQDATHSPDISPYEKWIEGNRKKMQQLKKTIMGDSLLSVPGKSSQVSESEKTVSGSKTVSRSGSPSKSNSKTIVSVSPSKTKKRAPSKLKKTTSLSPCKSKASVPSRPQQKAKASLSPCKSKASVPSRPQQKMTSPRRNTVSKRTSKKLTCKNKEMPKASAGSSGLSHDHVRETSESPRKRSRFYEYVEVSDNEGEVGFQPELLSGKRQRKPNRHHMDL